MNNTMTQFTETELTEIGRAMERAGYTDIESFIYEATIQLKNKALATSDK